MRFHILTLFKDMVSDGLNTSILGRAMEKNLIETNVVDIRDYTLDKHKKVDDYPYGGGAGMLMQAQPVYDAYQAVLSQITEKTDKKPRVIYVTPRGTTFSQKMAQELAREDDLVILCGHYEGFDERLRSLCDAEISIGDFILTGGELPSMVVVDSIVRLLDGVIDSSSLESESFDNNLLDYPVYTKPRDFKGMKVPEVLLSGNHAKIDAWRREESLKRTIERRSDLLEKSD